MKKADRKKLNDALEMALAPPRKMPRQTLDVLLDEYNQADELPISEVVDSEMPTDGVADSEAPSDVVMRDEPLTLPPVTSPEVPSTPVLAPVSPQRDYAKVANSIARDAIPSGLFKGNSKQLYDALYLRTRGAMPPRREIQARQSDLLQWAGVSLNTLRAHVRHLESIHLIKVTFALGDNSGAIYEVRVPEEVAHLLPPPPTSSSYLLLLPPPINSPNFSTETGNTTQHLANKALNPSLPPPPTTPSYPLLPPPPTSSYLLPEIGRRGSPKTIENTGTSVVDKTHNDDDDDEKKICVNDDDDTHTLRVPEGPWAPLIFELNDVVCVLQGQVSNTPKEQEAWREVGRILGEELKRAATLTETISSVPAFLATHLRRKFSAATKKEKAPTASTKEPKPQPTNKPGKPPQPTKQTATISNSAPDKIEKNTRPTSQRRFAECLRYAEHLQQTGHGITNPGGLANTLHRTGMSDTLIARFLAQETAAPAEAETPTRFDSAEIARQTEMTWNLVASKTHTIAELETNFGAFLHPEDWQQIKTNLAALEASSK